MARRTLEEPFESVLVECRPWLLRQAERMCGGAQNDAEVLVGDVCDRFLRRFEGEDLPDEQACAAWLARTLHDAFISGLLAHPLDPELERPQSRMKPVTAEELDKAVRGLSPEERRVFEASAQGKRYGEIAAALGLDRAAVVEHLHDARRQLLETLGADCAAGTR